MEFNTDLMFIVTHREPRFFHHRNKRGEVLYLMLRCPPLQMTHTIKPLLPR